MKTEEIEVAVKYQITYDPRNSGARDVAIKRVVEGLPVDLFSTDVVVGSYQITRGRARLLSTDAKPRLREGTVVERRGGVKTILRSP